MQALVIVSANRRQKNPAVLLALLAFGTPHVSTHHEFDELTQPGSTSHHDQPITEPVS